MTYQASTIEELEKKSLREVLRSVLIERKVLAVRLPDGVEVVIQPKVPLQTLPVLNGHVPEGWKEAIH